MRRKLPSSLVGDTGLGVEIDSVNGCLMRYYPPVALPLPIV